MFNVICLFFILCFLSEIVAACIQNHESQELFLLCTVDGKMNVFNKDNGRLLWSCDINNGPLITSSYSKSSIFQKFDDKILLIPSLKSDLIFEYHFESKELHPKSIQELELGETREKVENREVFVTGIGLYSGQKLYHCNAFGSCREEGLLEKEPVIDVTSVKRTVCSVEKDDIEQIDWCYQVSEIANLRVLDSTCSKCSKCNFLSSKPGNLHFQPKHSSETMNETQKSLDEFLTETLHLPIASIWILENGYLRQASMPYFKVPLHHDLLFIGNYNDHTYVQASSSMVKAFEENPFGKFLIESEAMESPVTYVEDFYSRPNLEITKGGFFVIGKYESPESTYNLEILFRLITSFIVGVFVYFVFHHLFSIATYRENWIRKNFCFFDKNESFQKA